MSQKKEIVIHEDFLSPPLFFRILKSLCKYDFTYKEDMHYHGRRDSHVLKILKNDKELTVFVQDEESNDIRIVGESQLLRDFVRDVATEQAAIFCSELCDCIADEASKAALRDTFRLNLKQSIDDIISQTCQDAGECSDEDE
ncbi:MAG: hypothetical protein ACXAB4_05960 [Candidatus Hodarchaeales archaeon]